MSNGMKEVIGGRKTRGKMTGGTILPWLNRFRKDEDGAVVAFTLYVFVLFMLMAGLGVDTMRHEMERTRLAAVADAASLAGATAPNNEAAKAVVRDYFAKSGMSDNLDDFGEDDVQITLNTSKVTVNTSVDVDTYLMKLAGIDTLSAAATATAEKRVPKLEIALVLDVSGSMRGTKLANLKVAAKQFVTTILNSADPGDAIISVVPFSFGVTPSDTIYEALDVVETHDYSTCIVFQDDDFNNTAIVPKPAIPTVGSPKYAQQIYTSRYDVSGEFQTLNSSWRSCYTDDYFRIFPYSISESALHTMIDALQADGNTSGNEGIKWAAALLDPAFQSVTTRLIANNEVNATLTNVPAQYNELATQKVIVMMGDGQNTNSYFFNDPNGLLNTDTPASHVSNDYRGPGSDLWRVEYETDVFDYAYRKRNPSRTSTDPSKCSNHRWVCVYTTESKTTYFLRDPDDDDYWDIDKEEWLTEAEFQALPATLGDDFIGWEQLTWEQAWGLMSPDYQKAITGNSTAYNDWYYNERVTGSKKNTRMAAACTATKAKKVVVYTIGFEVDAGGTAETELKACATSHSNYYRAAGVNINDAFNSIATNIQNLRLTQ